MDLIRLYYSSITIMPKLLLCHFLRYLGFYIEEIYNNKVTATQAVSVADVFIIGDGYTHDFGNQVNIGSENIGKSVIICTNGWKVSHLDDVKTILYYENDEQQLQFLVDFIDNLHPIIKQTISRSRLIRSLKKWKKNAHEIARLYCKYEIMPISQYSRCFYKEKELFDIALRRYEDYIHGLQELQSAIDRDTDLLQYSILYAKYELDSACKQNNYEYKYDTQDLLLQCNDLLELYGSNEALLFLKADILFELKGRWIQAFDLYQNRGISHCAYGYYKSGKIYRRYIKDYQVAIALLEKAVEVKPDYYAAWYQLALSHEEKGAYQDVVRECKEILNILSRRFWNHLLSPLELEYYYKVCNKIALISRYYLEDTITAIKYKTHVKNVVREIDFNNFMAVVWPSKSKDKNFVNKIKKVMHFYMDAPVTTR